MNKKFTVCLACLTVIVFAMTPMAFAQELKTSGNKTVVKVPKDGKNIDLKAGKSSLRVGDSKKKSNGKVVDAKAGDNVVKLKKDDKQKK